MAYWQHLLRSTKPEKAFRMAYNWATGLIFSLLDAALAHVECCSTPILYSLPCRLFFFKTAEQKNMHGAQARNSNMVKGSFY